MKINLKTTKRIIAFILVALFVSFIPVKKLVYANKDNNTLELSTEDSISIALKNNKDIKRINLSLSSMDRKLISFKKLSDKMDKALKALDQYQILYSKEKKMLQSSSKDKFQEYLNVGKKMFEISQDSDLNSNEKASRIQELQNEISNINFTDEEKKLLISPKELPQLFAYKIMFKQFGIENPYISDREKFEKFIKPRDFPWYSMEAEIKKTKNKKSQLKNTIRLSTIKLYNGIFQLNEAIKIKENAYNIQDKHFKQIYSKFKLGQVSKLDKDCAERELKKSYLDLQNLKRNKENTEMNFKKLLGLPLYKKLTIVDTPNCNKSLLNKDLYLNNALNKRAEILNDNIDIDVKKRELSIIKKYLASKDIEWIEAENSVSQSEIKLSNSKKLIEKDINTCYIDIENYKGKIDLSYKNLNLAKEKYKDANKTYEAGMSTILNTLKAKLYISQCEIENIKSKLDYDESVYKINFSSEIGYIDRGGSIDEK